MSLLRTVVAAGLSIVGVGAPASAAPATVLVDETFSNATVGDPLIGGLGFACLTGATDNARVKACPASQSGPVPVRGTTPGYLQLTDVSKSKAGSVLYDRPIPSSAGIDATFETYQHGGSGADGIAASSRGARKVVGHGLATTAACSGDRSVGCR